MVCHFVILQVPEDNQAPAVPNQDLVRVLRTLPKGFHQFTWSPITVIVRHPTEAEEKNQEKFILGSTPYHCSKFRYEKLSSKKFKTDEKRSDLSMTPSSSRKVFCMTSHQTCHMNMHPVPFSSGWTQGLQWIPGLDPRSIKTVWITRPVPLWPLQKTIATSSRTVFSSTWISRATKPSCGQSSISSFANGQKINR